MLKAPTIECLVCGERSKFKKGYQAILNAAKQVADEEVLYCQKHRDEAIRYICQKDQRLLCCKCILDPAYKDVIN